MGVAWPSRGDSREAEEAVTRAACGWLRDHGVKVCQAFATASDTRAIAAMERCGFRHTTQLALLQSSRSTAYSPAQLSFTRQRLPLASACEAALIATHEGTLDCAELNAPRSVTEILAGFASSGGIEWHMATLQGEVVGVVLIEHGKDLGAELTYLGLVPAFRGRGLGAELLRFALSEADTHLSDLKLSVDVRNTPALRLYTRHGFVEYDRREVWLASWPT